MMRVKCPACSQSLGIDESKGAAVGKCPACGQRFRIPAAKTPPAKSAPEKPRATGYDPTVAAPRSASPEQLGPKEPAAEKAASELREDESGLIPLDEEAKPAPPPARQRPPAKKDPQLEIEGEPEFEILQEGPRFKKPGAARDDDAVVADDEVRRRPPRQRPPTTEEEEDFEEKDRPRRRKRGRRRRGWVGESGQLIPGLDNYLAILVGIGALWAVLFVAALLVAPMAWVMSGFGGLVCMAGYVWFLVVAFQDEVFHGVLSFCCGLYALYYLCTHLDTTSRPFVIYLIGIIIHASAIPLGTEWLLSYRSVMPSR